MTGADLRDEYLAALRSTSWADLEPLRAAGVGGPGAAIAPAVARIRVSRGLYEPDPEGGAAFLLPVRLENPSSPEAADPENAVRNGGLVDLLAFAPEYPYRWARRAGTATWLGCVEPQFLMPDPVPVWRSPLHWLGNDCRGLVLLTRDKRERYRVLTHLDAIIAEDEGHANELRELLAHPWLAPPVFVRRGREVRHAA